MYYEEKNYVDETGKQITAKIPQIERGTDFLQIVPTATPVYTGTIGLTAMTPQGPMRMPFEFEFPSELSLAQCFEQFEEIAKKKVEELQEAQKERSRIIPATSIPQGLKLIK